MDSGWPDGAEEERESAARSYWPALEGPAIEDGGRAAPSADNGIEAEGAVRRGQHQLWGARAADAAFQEAGRFHFRPGWRWLCEAGRVKAEQR